MPRGKNYVNNDQGVALQAPGGKKKPSMEACFFGKACTRPNCIYRHDVPAAGSAASKKSNEPCMANLAAQCSFTSGTCRNRHVGQQEADTLRAKFAAIRCRHSLKCQTAGCLYIHPGDESDTPFGEPAHVAFPPMVSNGGVGGTANGGAGASANGGAGPAAAVTPPAAFSGSAWRPAPVATAWSQQGAAHTAAAAVPQTNGNGVAPAPAAVAAAPVAAVAPAPAAWGQKSHAVVTPSATKTPVMAATTMAFTPMMSYASTAAAANPQQASSTPPTSTTAAAKSGEAAAAAAAATALSLNAGAKAFVPGGC
jgi:hypothetical protein